MQELGKALLLLGFVTVIIGILLIFAPRIPIIGRLPGDIFIKKGNFTFYSPFTTSIILSIIITLLINFFLRK